MNIVVDVDDVLRNFVPTVVSKYNELYNTKYTIEDITTWDIASCLPELGNIYKFIQEYSGELLLLSKPIPKSLETLDSLHDLCNITIATHQFKGLEGVTLGWLYKNNVKYNNIFFGRDKFMLKGDIIVDDKVSNVQKFVYNNPGSKGFLMDKPWNRYEFNPYKNHYLNIERIKYLNQVLNYVKGKQ